VLEILKHDKIWGTACINVSHTPNSGEGSRPPLPPVLRDLGPWTRLYPLFYCRGCSPTVWAVISSGMKGSSLGQGGHCCLVPITRLYTFTEVTCTDPPTTARPRRRICRRTKYKRDDFRGVCLSLHDAAAAVAATGVNLLIKVGGSNGEHGVRGGSPSGSRQSPGPCQGAKERVSLPKVKSILSVRIANEAQIFPSLSSSNCHFFVGRCDKKWRLRSLKALESKKWGGAGAQ